MSSERPVACQCAYCMDDITVGTEAYQGEKEDVKITLCRIGCLASFTAKYDMDIDEFDTTVVDDH